MSILTVYNLLEQARKEGHTRRGYVLELEAIKEYLNIAYDPLLITTTGAVATAPGNSPLTDIENRQLAFNTIDGIGFINLNGLVNQWDLIATANFTITGIIPTSIDEQSASNALVVTGTGFEVGMTAAITSDKGTFVVDSISVSSPTTMTVVTTVTGDIAANEIATLTLTKGVYSDTDTFTLDADLEVTADNVSGIIPINASEDIILTFNKAITTLTSVTSDNVNIVVNSETLTDATHVTVNLDSSAASAEEEFELTITADDELVSYTLNIAPALAISSLSPASPLFNTPGGSNIVAVLVNKTITAVTSVESDNANVVIGGITFYSNGPDVEIDTESAGGGEAFNIRITADGETTEYFSANVDWAYEEFDESGFEPLGHGDYDDITGWNKTTYPTLYFYVAVGTTGTPGIEDLEIYPDKASRDARTVGSLLAIAKYDGRSDNPTIYEENSSGFGGTMHFNFDSYSPGAIGYVHAPGFSYTETEESGTPAEAVAGYSSITGWNKITTPVLYLYFIDGMDVEVYDNAVSRNARTAGDQLFTLAGADGSITEQNASGFGGSMSPNNPGAAATDTMYVTAS